MIAQALEWLRSLPAAWLRILLLVLVGWPLIHAAAKLLRRSLRKHLSAQGAMLLYQAVNTGGGVLLGLSVLSEMGFSLSTLLGAAGIAGVAIGFASQTSLSNLISGIFLIWERPFEVDDVVRIGGTSGVVVTIDLLSTKIRTFDNTLVRFPNETLIKSELVNITRFQIRRLDLQIGVAYKEDLSRVLQVLREVAEANPHCLDEPEPLMMIQGFGDSAINILFGVWFAKADLLALRNSILMDVHRRFREESIEIPFPHLTLYTGSNTEAFPLKFRPRGDG
jgi:small-conductance mechanosensitive channel